MKYFARFSELTGKKEEVLEMDDFTSVIDLKHRIMTEYPLLKRYESNMILARNEKFTADNEKLNSGDSIYLFPPVSGG
ncbi:MAG: MoaD/ThiS family protein [Thermoplasmataceae archaeon]